jgi:hypothetical protein
MKKFGLKTDTGTNTDIVKSCACMLNPCFIFVLNTAAKSIRFIKPITLENYVERNKEYLLDLTSNLLINSAPALSSRHIIMLQENLYS